MSARRMTTIINFYGGPGTGKSTTMARTFVAMKDLGLSVEMAPERVKIPVWAGEVHVLDDQLYILAKHNRALSRLDGNVDYVVTDAPLLMSLAYCRDPVVRAVVRDLVVGYRNLHVLLRRVKPYAGEGRVQDEAQARELDVVVRYVLRQEAPDYMGVDADESAHRYVLRALGLR